MSDFNDIIAKWETKVEGRKPSPWKDNITIGLSMSVIAFMVLLLVFAFDFVYTIYQYAASQQLPFTTVLLRLGKLDVLLVLGLVVLAAIALLYRSYSVYLFDLRKQLATLVIVCSVVGMVVSFNPGVRARYQAATSQIQTPLGSYFVARAETDMKTAQVEMGVITSIVALKKDTYEVTLRTSGTDQTFIMVAPAIPPLQTPIWVAYSAKNNTKTMERMGVLPGGLL